MRWGWACAAACALACAGGEPRLALPEAPPWSPPQGPSLVVAPGRTCALGALGEVYCWGEGFASTAPWSPARLPLGAGARALSATPREACALGPLGEVSCWPWPSDAANPPKPAPRPLPEPAEALAAQGGATCARLRGGAWWCWGVVEGFGWGGAVAPVFEHPEPTLWGPGAWRSQAQVGSTVDLGRALRQFEAAMAARLDARPPAQGPEPAAGQAPHRCAREPSAIRCDGPCRAGACGPTPDEDPAWAGHAGPLWADAGAVCGLDDARAPTALRCEGALRGAWPLPQGARFLGLAGAYVDPFACVQDDLGRAWCYRASSTQPARVPPLDAASALAASSYRVCAERAGEVRCHSAGGAAGLDDPSAWTRPAWPNFQPARLLASNPLGFCALDSAHTLGCAWMANHPDPALPDHAYLPAVPGRVVGAVEAPWGACAWTQAGEAWCWRHDHRGPQGGARKVEGLGEVVQVVAAREACALGRAGEVWCWSWPEGEARPSPAYARADALLASAGRACAREGARLRCWGEGLEAQGGLIPWPPSTHAGP